MQAIVLREAGLRHWNPSGLVKTRFHNRHWVRDGSAPHANVPALLSAFICGAEQSAIIEGTVPSACAISRKAGKQGSGHRETQTRWYLLSVFMEEKNKSTKKERKKAL